MWIKISPKLRLFFEAFPKWVGKWAAFQSISKTTIFASTGPEYATCILAPNHPQAQSILGSSGPKGHKDPISSNWQIHLYVYYSVNLPCAKKGRQLVPQVHCLLLQIQTLLLCMILNKRFMKILNILLLWQIYLNTQIFEYIFHEYLFRHSFVSIILIWIYLDICSGWINIQIYSYSYSDIN